jgi:hypothetical protein
MDTDKYMGQSNQTSVPTGQPGNIRRDIILKKKQKIEKIKQFLDIKVKIFQLMNLNKYDQAKNSYQALYLLYQDILKTANPVEANKLQKDLSSIYAKLVENVQTKRVKRIQDNDNYNNNENKESNTAKKKIITTDFDMIMKIVEENGKMGLSEIQSQFNISRRLAEEWIQILSDYGLVEIKYLPIGGIEIVKITKR